MSTTKLHHQDRSLPMLIDEHSSHKEQEPLLVEWARRGGTHERDTLLFYLLPALQRFARRYAGDFVAGLVEQQDLVQEGCASILCHMRQALTRNVDHVCPYLLKMAYHAMSEYVVSARHPIATPYDVEPIPLSSLDMVVPWLDECTLADTIPDSPFGVTIPETTRDHTPLHAAIRDLKDKERAMVVRHFGLYIHACEPATHIASSLGIKNGNNLLKLTLTKLAIKLKTAYPQYCSPTRETRQVREGHVLAKPLTDQQRQRLETAHQRLDAQQIPITAQTLRREAKIDDRTARRYLQELRAQMHVTTQEERLNQAMEELQQRGEKMTLDALAKLAHVSKGTALLYVHMCSGVRGIQEAQSA